MIYSCNVISWNWICAFFSLIVKNWVKIGGYFDQYFDYVFSTFSFSILYLIHVCPILKFYFFSKMLFLLFFAKNLLIYGGLAFTPNLERSYVFCPLTLVELPLLFVSRHKCSTPPQNACFTKFHQLPKSNFFIGGFNA